MVWKNAGKGYRHRAKGAWTPLWHCQYIPHSSLTVRFGDFPGIGFKKMMSNRLGAASTYTMALSEASGRMVILRNDIGDPIAIYDVKTGGARLTASRAQELRDAVAPNSDIYVVIEFGATASRNSCALEAVDLAPPVLTS